MSPVAVALVDGVIDALANDPILAALVAVLFFGVLGIYLYLRRTLMNLKSGYEDGYRK